MNDICYLITDNGSYRPEATFSLRDPGQPPGQTSRPRDPRRIAAALPPRSPPTNSMASQRKLSSLLSVKKREEGFNRFMVTPMFFGPSAAIKEYMPQRVEDLKQNSWPELEVLIAPCVVEPLDPADTRMAQILVDNIEAAREAQGMKHPAVAVVDHGARESKSPKFEITSPGKSVHCFPKLFIPHVTACSMERREGDEYAFNEPLLENVIGTEGYQAEVIISMLFASPGRHAGPGGDVAEICREATEGHPGLTWHMTDLVAGHDGIIEILAERFHQGNAIRTRSLGRA